MRGDGVRRYRLSITIGNSEWLDEWAASIDGAIELSKALSKTVLGTRIYVSDCGTAGKHLVRGWSVDGKWTYATACRKCGGSGTRMLAGVPDECDGCNGAGVRV
jgi:hypothetical protein